MGLVFGVFGYVWFGALFWIGFGLGLGLGWVVFGSYGFGMLGI